MPHSNESPVLGWLDVPLDTSEMPFPPTNPIQPEIDPNEAHTMLRVLEAALDILADPDPEMKIRPDPAQVLRITNAIAQNVATGRLPLHEPFGK